MQGLHRGSLRENREVIVARIRNEVHWLRGFATGFMGSYDPDAHRSVANLLRKRCKLARPWLVRHSVSLLHLACWALSLNCDSGPSRGCCILERADLPSG